MLHPRDTHATRRGDPYWILCLPPPEPEVPSMPDPLKLPQRLELDIQPQLVEQLEEMALRSGRSIPEIIQGLISGALAPAPVPLTD